MALLPWNEDEKKDEQASTLTPVKSVQDMWADNATVAANDTQADTPQQTNYLLSEESAQNDAAIRQRKADEAAAAAQAAAQAAQAANAAEEVRQKQAEQKTTTKYTPAVEGAKSEGLWGFIKGIGAGIQQGVGGGLADIAIQGGGALDYAAQRLRGVSDEQASADVYKRYGAARDWVHNQTDITGNKFVGTQDVDAAAGRIAAGRGTAQDYIGVGGKGLQAGLDATMFINPTMAARSAAFTPVKQAASWSARNVYRNPVVQKAARDAAFFGTGQGIATGAQTYGQTGDWGEAAKLAAQDAVIGAALQGTLDLGMHGVGVGANRTINSLRRDRLKLPDVETPNSVIDEAIQQIESRNNVETTDGNVAFEPEAQTGTTREVTPYAPVAQELQPAPKVQEPVQATPDVPEAQPKSPVEQAVDEVRQRQQAQAEAQIQVPQEATPAPDGAVENPANVVPASTVDVNPPARAEEVRALQDARAGKSQAEEAAINQRIQELRDETPNYFREDSEIPDINRILKNEDTAAGGEPIADYYRRAKGEDWYTTEMTPDEYLDQAARAMGQNPETWRGAHTGNVEAYAEAMRNGDKFPMPYINKVAGSQEGRTRALAAKAAGQEKMRVAVADKYTPERYAERQRFEAEQAATRAEIERSERLLEMLRDNDVEPLTDARAPRESDIANNAQIRELDNRLEMIDTQMNSLRQAGRSENYSQMRQLEKSRNDVIAEQQRIAEDIRGGGTMADGTLQDGPMDNWEGYRQRSVDNLERIVEKLDSGRYAGQQFAKGYKQNAEALRNGQPNKVYRVDPKTGKPSEHPASELLASFSRSIGEDLPPIAIGNVAEPGSMRRLNSNWKNANATYTPNHSRLDYKEKRSVYHETMHHIDSFIDDYTGSNPKMLELKQLRDSITPEEMVAFAKEDTRVFKKNTKVPIKEEYIAHAMDSLLDGRLKAGEVGPGVLKYIKAFFSTVKEALTSSHIYGKVHKAELAQYVKRMDSVIHDGKIPKQKPLTPEELTPGTQNLPPKMAPKGATKIPVKSPTKKTPGGNVPDMPKNPKGGKTPAGKSVSDWAKRVYSNTDLHKDMKRRLAHAVGKAKDTESSVAELLSGTKLSDKNKSAVIKQFAKLEEVANEFNKIMKNQRKGFKAGDTPETIAAGIEKLSTEDAIRANHLIDQYGRLERDIDGYIRKAQGQMSLAQRGANALQNLTGARNASLLSSVGGIERNVTQELGANILDSVMHPVIYVKGLPQVLPEIARSYKRAAREFTVKPKTISEAFPYLIGNTYRTLMAPVTGQANFRKGIMREALAESLLRAEGLDPSRAEIKKFAGTMGADSEVVANNLAGVLNGMSNHGQAMKVMKAYQEFIHNGSAEAKKTFMENAERSANLAAQLTRAGRESNKASVRATSSLVNIVMPFVTTATNLAKTTGTYHLNPMARSVPDAVLESVRKNPENALALLKANAVKGGTLAAVYGLYASGIVQYNNGDEVDKPRGISIHLGGDEYFPVRGTPIELPIAAVTAAGEIANDVADGNPREWQYYAGIVSNSLPYIDNTNNMVAAGASMLDSNFGGTNENAGDNFYKAKAYGVNMAKSFVPYSNNGIQAGINAWQGKSTNVKKTYDESMGTWLGNSLKNSYGMGGNLPDSRDAAGRVRTVDQQGGFTIKKNINDANTKTYNDTIDTLVDYGRKAGLSNGTQDAFNTYDDGSNNNFRSVQGAITFLDAPEVDGKKKPDSAKRLESNKKIAVLSQQIYDGFFGDKAGELLTLDGENLYSDVSMPNKDGTKNSSKPISMQAITNAIAQTDLPEGDRNKMYEISKADEKLYNQLKAKEITYDQYTAAKAEGHKVYTDILSRSENFQKMSELMGTLKEQGFFDKDGLGSTQAGQTYLWNSLNALLGSKGKTPAADYPETAKSGWGSGGRGGSRRPGATYKPGKTAPEGLKWAKTGSRRFTPAKRAKYTPAEFKVKLGNRVKKNRTQNYSDRSF